MAKSWKKLIKTTDSQGKNPLNDFQPTLDEIAAQKNELSHLLKERNALEGEMDSLLQPNTPTTEDPRFAGSIESFKDKREKEKNRSAQKKKLEERILHKSKELEKWEENQDRLRRKLQLQKKLLKKKETNQDPSTSQKAPLSKEKSFEKNWFDTNEIRKKKDAIEQLKKVSSEERRKAANSLGNIREKQAKPDKLGLKDPGTFRKKADQEPTGIRTLKDDWDEKRENRKEKLKEKISLQKLSEKLEEMKRFNPSSKTDDEDLMKFPELKLPEIKSLDKLLEKAPSLDERQVKAAENALTKKADQKETEQKEIEKREKQKEHLLFRKKAERKEEERSNKMKERKKDKYT